jgi:hypothetical protein
MESLAPDCGEIVKDECVMKLKTRAVEIAGITSQPDKAWMTQVARNLTDARDGFLRGVQYGILDRDPLDTAAFRRLLRGSGVKPLVLPAWSPNLNASAERFVGSAKSEYLERIVPLGEGHLRSALREFVQHYHEERPHQGLGNELNAPKTTSIGTGPVNVLCAARRPAQVPLPRGRVARWAAFSHRTGSRRLIHVARNFDLSAGSQV